MEQHCGCCHEPLVGQVAQNSDCANTFGRVEYIYIHITTSKD